MNSCSDGYGMTVVVNTLMAVVMAAIITVVLAVYIALSMVL